MDLYVALPEGPGPFPAVIVLQEAFGVNHHIRSVAERFCAEGYAVVSPDLFHRTIRRMEGSYTDFTAMITHFQAVTKEGLTSDLKASYDWLQQQTTVNENKIGSVGFCLGGRVSFLANAVLPLSAVISYYGGGLEQLANEAPNLHAPHLFYWGGLDKIDTIVNAGKDYTNVVISYADHGFHCDDRDSYHPLAATETWAHTLTFFENRLK